MDNAAVVNIQDVKKNGSMPKADVYIWQKHVMVEVAEQLAQDGRANWWDVCDPMWWFSPNECREILRTINGGIVASNEALAADLTDWSGWEVTTIPDRLEPDHFPLYREHKDVKPVRFIWFGIAVNRVALGAAWANLDRLHANGYEIELTIYDDRPDMPMFVSGRFPVYYSKWTLEGENRVISSHDVALLPPYPGPWGDVKSNNKILTAHICNLPHLGDSEYPEYVMFLDDAVHPNKTAAENRDNWAFREATMRSEYHVRTSAEDWEQLLCE